MKNYIFFLEENTEGVSTISLVDYFLEIFLIMVMMCLLVYLSFSIVKKSQLGENRLGTNEQEENKIRQKIDIKNQIEIIQNGIVQTEEGNYIIPARKNQGIFIYDESIPKIKHLNSQQNPLLVVEEEPTENDDRVVISDF